MKDNLIIYVSSHNNYDMLEGEVFKNINTEGFEFINVDDKSCDGEISKGKAMCKKHGVVFLENKSRGVNGFFVSNMIITQYLKIFFLQ